MGTTLRVDGAKRIVKEFCRSARSSGGLTIWANKEPIPSDCQGCFDYLLVRVNEGTVEYHQISQMESFSYEPNANSQLQIISEQSILACTACYQQSATWFTMTADGTFQTDARLFRKCKSISYICKRLTQSSYFPRSSHPLPSLSKARGQQPGCVAFAEIGNLETNTTPLDSNPR